MQEYTTLIALQTLSGAVGGKLLGPLQIEGKWYYQWDTNGDRTFDTTDMITHDVLDGVFSGVGIPNLTDANGVAAPSTVTNTDATYRFFTATTTAGNVIKLALPTADGLSTAQGALTGSAASGQGTADNPVHDDLAAIWDAFNGTGTAAGGAASSMPGKWPPQDFAFWAANKTSDTLNGNGSHLQVNFTNGTVQSTWDSVHTYVLLQLL